MANGAPLAQLAPADKLALHLSATAAGFYVTTSDSLRLSVIASVATTLIASGQLLTVDGEVIPFTVTVVATTDRVVASSTTQLTNGWLMNMTVQPLSGSPITGQAFARLQIVRGGGAGALVIATLTTGYVTAQQPIVWPFGAMRSSVEGRGALRSIQGTNPAAGVEISETVPTGARWRLHSMLMSLLTDATAGNRILTLAIDDGTTTLFSTEADSVQGASSAFNYTLSAANPFANINSNTVSVPLPAAFDLLAGWRIRTTTVSLAAGDNWAAPQLLVEEWLEGA